MTSSDLFPLAPDSLRADHVDRETFSNCWETFETEFVRFENALANSVATPLSFPSLLTGAPVVGDGRSRPSGRRSPNRTTGGRGPRPTTPTCDRTAATTGGSIASPTASRRYSRTSRWPSLETAIKRRSSLEMTIDRRSPLDGEDSLGDDARAVLESTSIPAVEKLSGNIPGRDNAAQQSVEERLENLGYYR